MYKLIFPSESQAGTQDAKVERTVVCCMELFCEIIRDKLCHCSRQRACQQTCVNFSLGHKNTTALTQQLLHYSAKQANRHLLFCVQVDAKSSLTKVRKNISSSQRARFVAPFEKSVVHHDWIQLHVLNGTRITVRATYTRKRYTAPIVELILILLCVRSAMLTRQHVQHDQTVMEGSQIAY